jgi:hypothetical protein
MQYNYRLVNRINAIISIALLLALFWDAAALC